MILIKIRILLINFKKLNFKHFNRIYNQLIIIATVLIVENY